jgi:hypothetical protein
MGNVVVVKMQGLDPSTELALVGGVTHELAELPYELSRFAVAYVALVGSVIFPGD